MSLGLIHVLADSDSFYSDISDQCGMQVKMHILPEFYNKYKNHNKSHRNSIDYLSLTNSDWFRSISIYACANYDSCTFGDCLQLISEDSSIVHMAQRTIFNSNTVGTNILLFSRYIFNVIGYIAGTDLSCVVFGVPPHSVYDYLWLKAFRYLKIQSFIMQTHVYIPHHTHVWDNSFSLVKPIPSSDMIDNCTKTSRLQYQSFQDTGRPIDINSLECELTKELFPKWSHRNCLHPTMSTDSRHQSNAVFYLAFEPEATTNPMGGSFFEQRTAVEYARSCLPNNIQLIIKDHPWYNESSSDKHFNGVCNPMRFRDKEFAESIGKLDNTVYISSSEVSATQLISKSILTISLNGSVILDSILRGIPAAVLGLSGYQDLEGTIDIIRFRQPFNQTLSTAYNELLISSPLNILEQALLGSWPGDPYGPCSDLANYKEDEPRQRNENCLVVTLSALLTGHFMPLPPNLLF